eukprot:7382798-Lingulodinium_polyedra.AAC.1
MELMTGCMPGAAQLQVEAEDIEEAIALTEGEVSEESYNLLTSLDPVVVLEAIEALDEWRASEERP